MGPFFVFDVESIGIHGEGFAVAGGTYDIDGSPRAEFAFSCPPAAAAGDAADLAWVLLNVPPLTVTHKRPRQVRDAFWCEMQEARRLSPSVIVAAECNWPVEASFLSACVRQNMPERKWRGPYPLHDIASFMAAAGMDPAKEWPRLPSERPEHDPQADARLSSRMLISALRALGMAP